MFWGKNLFHSSEENKTGSEGLSRESGKVQNQDLINRLINVLILQPKIFQRSV